LFAQTTQIPTNTQIPKPVEVTKAANAEVKAADVQRKAAQVSEKKTKRMTGVSSTGLITQNTNKRTSALTSDEIIGSYEYLPADADGNIYGAAFYLYNASDNDINVYWWFEGSVNVNFSPDKSDSNIIPAKKKVWVTTCTCANRNKSWESGTFNWKW
jgi:hypothetical protein